MAASTKQWLVGFAALVAAGCGGRMARLDEAVGGDAPATTSFIPSGGAEGTGVTALASSGGGTWVHSSVGRATGTATKTTEELREIEELAVGLDTSCIRLGDASLRCWGDNQYGQLGDGTSIDRAVPTRVMGIDDAAGVATSGLHTCARSTGGTVRCWGMGDQGQLGIEDASLEQRQQPRVVPGISSATDLSLGPNHTCAVIYDRSVQCWGANPYGELGDGSTQQRFSPTTVVALRDAMRVCAADDKSCALLANGTLRCWGYNVEGQLADGTYVDQHAPVLVHGLANITQLDVGKWDTCVISRDLNTSCWGSNDLGYDGEPGVERGGKLFAIDRPSPVAALSGATQISVGPNHACVVLSDGRVKCIGSNRYGQLGSGEVAPTAEGVFVADLPPVEQVEVGLHHTCARTRNAIWCWGQNNLGQLGDGTVSVARATPLRVTNVP